MIPLPALGAPGLAAVAVLVLATRPFFDLIWRTPDWPLVLATFWGLAVILVLGVAWRAAGWRWLPDSMRRMPLFWVVLGLALASALWSFDPLLTLRKAGWLWATTLVGLALGYLLSPRVLMGALFWAFAIVLSAALAAALLFPDYGIFNSMWKGTTPHHTDFGLVAAGAALFALVGLLFGRIERFLALPMLGLAAACVVLSTSATALVVLVAGLCVVLAFTGGRRLRLAASLVAVLVPIGMAGTAAIGLHQWERTTSLLNKDVTATDRTSIWRDAIRIIEHRPLTGFGYGAVFGLYDQSYFPERATLTWASHAHNGYLQVATQLGLPALGAAVALLIRTLLHAVLGFVRWSSPFALFAIGYGFMFLILNFAEARLFEHGLFEWLVFAALAAALARHAGERRRRALPGRRSGQREHSRSAPAAGAARERAGERSRHRLRRGPGRARCGAASRGPARSRR